MVKGWCGMLYDRSCTDFAGYLKNGQSYVAHADLNKLKWSVHSDDSAKVISLPGQILAP